MYKCSAIGCEAVKWERRETCCEESELRKGSIHRPSKGVRASRVDEVEGCLVLFVTEYIHLYFILSGRSACNRRHQAHRNNGSEDFFLEGDGLRILAQDDRRLNEVSDRVIS